MFPPAVLPPAVLDSPASPMPAPPSAFGILLRSTSVMSVQLATATSPPREASAKEYLTKRIGIPQPCTANGPGGTPFFASKGRERKGAGVVWTRFRDSGQ